MIKLKGLLNKKNTEAISDLLLCRSVISGNTEAFSKLAAKYQKKNICLRFKFF